MRRWRCLQGARSCGGKWLPTLLVAVIAIDAPLRAFTQAAAAQPAAAQSTTAAKLANVPDSIPYEANPYPQIPQTRTMSSYIKNALDDAGIDSREVTPTYDETPTADTVTIEGAFPDGDIIVTGKLVNGRIVLTKQFKPLLPDGVGLGAAVTIPSNPTPATNVSVPGAGEKPSPAVPADAPPLPPEIVRTANLDLEAHYKAEAAKLEGPFVVTGPGETIGTTEDVPVSLPVIIGLLIVRDLYYAMLMAYARYLRQLKRLPDEEKKALVEKLIAAAPRLNAAYEKLQAEERSARSAENLYRRSMENPSYQRYSSMAEYWNRKGDVKQAEWNRKKADETEWGQYLKSRAKFMELLGENKEQQLLGLYRDTWSVGDAGFLFQTFAKPPASTEEGVAIFNQYLTLNHTDLETEAANAKGITTFAEAKRFLEPKYDRVRDTARLITASSGVNLPGQSVDALGDIHQSITSANLASQTAFDLFVGVVLLLALVFFPVLGAVLNAGYAGYQVVKEGNELRIAWTRVDESKRTAGVTGQEHVFTEEDRERAQGEKFLVTAGMAITDLKTGMDAAPLLNQELRRRLARTRSQSGTAGQRAGGTSATPGSAPPAAAASGAVDRGATTTIDVPAARADAAAVAAQRQKVSQELEQVNQQLVPGATVGRTNRLRLQERRAELQAQLRQLDEEQARLDLLIAQGQVDRAGETIVDPNALQEELGALNKREFEIQMELAGIPSNPKSPAQQQKKLALEKEVDALRKQVTDTSARITKAEKDALENLTTEQAQQRAFALNEEGIKATARRNALKEQISRETDPVRKAALEKEVAATENSLRSLIKEYDRVKAIALRELDDAEAVIAREALDQEIELALRGVSQQRVDEITKGYVKGQTTDLEKLGRMTDELFEARLSRPILEMNNPEHQKAIKAALQEATLIRGGLATARETGRLPDALQEHLTKKGGIPYIDTLYDRYFKGGSAGAPAGGDFKGKLDERYPIVQNELLDELKTYYKPPAGTSGGVAGQKVADIAKTAADRAGNPRRSSDSSSRNESRDRQQEAATRALLGGTSFGDRPPLSGPVGRNPGEEIAILNKQIAANAVRLALLAPRAFGGGTGSAEARAAQDEFISIEVRQEAIVRERRLLQRDIVGEAAASPTRTAPAGASRGEGTNPSGAGTPATGAPPSGTGMRAVPSKGSATPTGGKEVGVNTPFNPRKPGGSRIPFADSIPEGPPFAISGAVKPMKEDAPTTATTVPTVVRLDGTNSNTFNPAIINSGVRLLLVQYTAAEGQEITVPAASDPAKQPDLARAPPRWNPRAILERIAGLVMAPHVRANRSREPSLAARASRHDMQQRGNPATASTSSPPIKIVLTSLGRSSGDAFQMTVLNEGPAPVTLTGDAFVLEPVGEVTQAAVDRELAPMRAAGRATATLKAYCVEFLKQPPAVGMLFRLAPEGVQQRFANVARIFGASRRLKEQGRMQPGQDDPSDPASYFDDIRQWAIWTQEQGFDEKSYGRAFTEHSRKNVEAAGHKWTRELEKAFAGLAAGRWQAVQTVLREAAAAP